MELDQVKLEMAAVRVENEDLHVQLAKYGQVIMVYDNQHTSPSRNTITQKEINTQSGEQKKEHHLQARPTRRSQRCICQPEGTNNHSTRAMRFVVGNRNVRMQICKLAACVYATHYGCGVYAAPRYAAKYGSA